MAICILPRFFAMNLFQLSQKRDKHPKRGHFCLLIENIRTAARAELILRLFVAKGELIYCNTKQCSQDASA